MPFWQKSDYTAQSFLCEWFFKSGNSKFKKKNTFVTLRYPARCRWPKNGLFNRYHRIHSSRLSPARQTRLCTIGRTSSVTISRHYIDVKRHRRLAGRDPPVSLEDCPHLLMLMSFCYRLDTFMLNLAVNG